MTELLNQAQGLMFEILEFALFVIVAYAAKMGREILLDVRARIKAKLGDETFGVLERLAITGIQFAEQEGIKQATDDFFLSAKQKYEMAFTYVQDGLDKLGITGFTALQIKGAIEAAVRQGFHKDTIEVIVSGGDK